MSIDEFDFSPAHTHEEMRELGLIDEHDNRREGVVAYVTEYPNCDFCSMEGRERLARFDGKTKRGPWGNMCEPHMLEHGIGCGIGKGQVLMRSGVQV